MRTPIATGSVAALGARDVAVTVLSLLETARRQLERDSGAADAAIARASTLLRIEIDRRAHESEPIGQLGRLTGWQIRRVREFVDGNLEATIRVKDLSEIAKLGPAHFSRAFKRTFGETVHVFLVRRRLDRAGHLMLASDATLSEIALMCGFSDQAHLSKLFRQSAGQSPAAWRRERRDR